MSSEVDGEALRQVMRWVPSPVTVVTAATPDEIRGITIGSFTSVSLDPPLICFNVSDTSRMHPVICEVERFNVHVLSDRQVKLSTSFAEPERGGKEQFQDVQYTLDPYGIPVLQRVVAQLACKSHAVYPTGDHVMVVGRVCSIKVDERRRPLVFVQQGYFRLGQRIAAGKQLL